MLDIKCLSMFYINKSFVNFHSAINVYETLCNPQTISITYIFREGPTLLWASPVRKTHVQRLFPKIYLESGIRKLLRPDIWLGSYYWLILVTFFRIKAATALYMVAVVEVSESNYWDLDHTRPLWIILDHTGIQWLDNIKSNWLLLLDWNGMTLVLVLVNRAVMIVTKTLLKKMTTSMLLIFWLSWL